MLCLPVELTRRGFDPVGFTSYWVNILCGFISTSNFFIIMTKIHPFNLKNTMFFVGKSQKKASLREVRA